MGLLDNKVALVTGGARGLGASHVRKLAEEGARVAATDILVEKGEALAQELGDQVIFIEHDVTQRDAWKRAIEQTESTFGPISVLPARTHPPRGGCPPWPARRLRRAARSPRVRIDGGHR